MGHTGRPSAPYHFKYGGGCGHLALGNGGDRIGGGEIGRSFLHGQRIDSVPPSRLVTGIPGHPGMFFN